MSKYLVSGAYTAEGMKGLLREGGSSRREAVTKAIEGLGGKVEAFYYAFGGEDVYLIVEAPDNVTTAAVCVAVGAAGGASTKTTVLLTPEEVDQAVQKSVGYRAPGA